MKDRFTQMYPLPKCLSNVGLRSVGKVFLNRFFLPRLSGVFIASPRRFRHLSYGGRCEITSASSIAYSFFLSIPYKKNAATPVAAFFLKF